MKPTGEIPGEKILLLNILDLDMVLFENISVSYEGIEHWRLIQASLPEG